MRQKWAVRHHQDGWEPDDVTVVEASSRAEAIRAAGYDPSARCDDCGDEVWWAMTFEDMDDTLREKWGTLPVFTE